MSVEWPEGSNADLLAGPADYIAPNIGGGNYLDSPEPADGSKVLIVDTDHLCGVCADGSWVWKSFTRGINPIYMDPYDGAAIGFGAAGRDPQDPRFPHARRAMGHTVAYASRIDLARMTPQPSRALSGYCLAKVTPEESEILVYNPFGGETTVDLSGAAGALEVEWFNADDGSGPIAAEGIAGGAVGFRVFVAPFFGAAVLYIHSPAPPPAVEFHRGDANADGSLDIGDAVYTLLHIFKGTPPVLPCRHAADVQDDGRINIADAVAFLAYVFLGRDPGTGEEIRRGCIEDATPANDPLDCAGFPPCQ
jgi:hypothetical protein